MKKNIFVQPRHDSEAERKFSVDIGELESQLKPMIIGLVEKAFRKYCKAHGLTDEDQLRLEWNRFHKILNRTL